MGPDDITKLLARTALRDRNAFDQLYRLTSAKLFGVCLRVLKDRAEAEEALQEIYIKIWHKADRFTANDLSPITWLVAVARNHCIDRLRAKKKGNRPLDEAAEIADTTPGPEAQAAAHGERRRIDGCLDQLEAQRALAVRGAYLDGDSYAELAERFSVPLNTMRTWLRRSLLKLKDCLEA